MKKILVTGAYGFLGRHIARRFANEGFYVVGIGHGKWNFAEHSLFGIQKWFEADITLDSLTAAGDYFDAIIHCAGGASVSYSISNTINDFAKTVDSTMAVLEYIRHSKKSIKLVYASSAAVYGENNGNPIAETDERNPVSPYGVHKKIAEDLCLSYSNNYGVDICIVRFFSIYGPGLTKQLLWDASNKLLGFENEAVFFGTGEELRDWIYIDDAVSLVFELTTTLNAPTVCNCGSGKAVVVADVLNILKEAICSNKKINFNGIVKKGDPCCYLADIGRALSLSWKPSYAINEGIHIYADWYNQYHHRTMQ